METKYSPFNITSILRHGSYSSNRGHFNSVKIHEPVRLSPAPMSLAERLAGLPSFFSFVSSEFFTCQCYCLLANLKLHFLRRQGHFFIDLCHVKREKRKCDDNDGLLSFRRAQRERPATLLAFSDVY